MPSRNSTASAIIELPKPAALLDEWRVCSDHVYWEFCSKCQGRPRTFRLLADWMQQGKFKGDWLAELPAPLRKAYRQSQPAKVLDLRLDAAPNVFTLHKIRPTADGKSIVEVTNDQLSQESFQDWLLLAWCVRQAEHERSLRRPDVKKAFSAYAPQGLPLPRLLQLTYVPREIIETIPDVRASLDRSRRALSSALMSSQRKIAKGQEAEFLEEAPPCTDWEQWWATSMGMDKRTSQLSRQWMWTWIFVPLIEALRPLAKCRKQEYWVSRRDGDTPIPDDAFIQASRLVHLLYPDLWEDHWQRVKARYLSFFKP